MPYGTSVLNIDRLLFRVDVIKAMQARECGDVRARVAVLLEKTMARSAAAVLQSGFASHVQRASAGVAGKTPFARMDDCRAALAKLDRLGWSRSYHQRIFHEDFLQACTRTFWKPAPPGQFARDHHKILTHNGWEHLAQEILISTPRRFGKTISVSMFAAALIVSCPRVEVSIYSTCKRISQKLLRNIQKVIYMICDQDIATYELGLVRQNMEEVVLKGSESAEDVRVVNSYPSKVDPTPVASCACLWRAVWCLSRVPCAARCL